MGGFIERHGDKIKYAIITAGFLAAGWVLYSTIRGPDVDVEKLTRTRTLIDSKTEEVFENYRLPDGDTVPHENPNTGERTLYPAEACYWTRDNRAKVKPTYVLLNDYAGKSGPTTCPDCGRRVVAHNPPPPPDLLMQAVDGP